jgi:uncharacterized cofD-like protein
VSDLTPDATAPAVVALGGGHGLAATLAALRRITDRVTAVVTVADDGGSSGRLRAELGILPPGDLRMALAALCADDPWGRTWADVLQHRFTGDGQLHGHALGNLLIAAVWDRLGDHVAGLDLVGRLLGARGRVLPMAAVPLAIRARVAGLDAADPARVTVVTGQHEVAVTTGRVLDVSLVPEQPPACPEALAAVLAADVVVLGPGSWFTSVLPHVLLPELAAALRDTPAARVVVLNLAAPEGETHGFQPQDYLRVLAEHAKDMRLDAVIADAGSTADPAALAAATADLGADLVMADVVSLDTPTQHDPDLLAGALSTALGALVDRGRMRPWR